MEWLRTNTPTQIKNVAASIDGMKKRTGGATTEDPRDGLSAMGESIKGAAAEQRATSETATAAKLTGASGAEIPTPPTKRSRSPHNDDSPATIAPGSIVVVEMTVLVDNDDVFFFARATILRVRREGGFYVQIMRWQWSIHRRRLALQR